MTFVLVFALLLLAPPVAALQAVVEIDRDVHLADATWGGRWVLITTAGSKPGLLLVDRFGQEIHDLGSLLSGTTPPPVTRSGGTDFLLSQDGRFVLAHRSEDHVGVIRRLDRRSGTISELLRARAEGLSPSPSSPVSFSDPQLSLSGLQVRATPIRVTFATFGVPVVSANGPGPVVLAQATGVSVPPALPSGTLDSWLAAGGQHLLLRTPDQSFRLDLRSGEVHPLGRAAGAARISADGRIIALVRADAPDKVLRLNVATGKLNILASGLAAPRVDGLSADGSRVAFSTRQAAWTWSVDGLERLAEPAGFAPPFDLALSPGGRLLAWRSSDALVVTDVQGRMLAEVRGLDDTFALRRVLLTDRGAAFESRGALATHSATGDYWRVWFLPASAAADDPAVRLAFEYPPPGGTVSGIGTLRGWAFSTRADIESVRLEIDGEDAGPLPHGGPRADVAGAFPEVPSASRSGYATAYNFNDLAPGYHRARIVATDGTGAAAARAVDFVVETPSRQFLDGRNGPLTGVAEAGADGTVVLRDVSANGRLVDVALAWQPAAQQFEIIEVRPAASGRDVRSAVP